MVTSYKYLGILTDEKLSFKSNTEKLVTELKPQGSALLAAIHMWPLKQKINVKN